MSDTSQEDEIKELLKGFAFELNSPLKKKKKRFQKIPKRRKSFENEEIPEEENPNEPLSPQTPGLKNKSRMSSRMLNTTDLSMNFSEEEEQFSFGTEEEDLPPVNQSQEFYGDEEDSFDNSETKEAVLEKIGKKPYFVRNSGKRAKQEESDDDETPPQFQMTSPRIFQMKKTKKKKPPKSINPHVPRSIKQKQKKIKSPRKKKQKMKRRLFVNEIEEDEEEKMMDDERRYEGIDPSIKKEKLNRTNDIQERPPQIMHNEDEYGHEEDEVRIVSPSPKRSPRRKKGKRRNFRLNNFVESEDQNQNREREMRGQNERNRNRQRKNEYNRIEEQGANEPKKPWAMIVKKLQDEIKFLKNENSEQINSVEQQISYLNEEIDALKNDNQDLLKKEKKNETELFDFKKTVSKKNELIKTLTIENERLQDRHNKELEALRTNDNNGSQEIIEENQKLQRMVKNLELGNNKLNKDMNEVSKSLNSAKQDNQKLETRNRELELKIDSIKGNFDQQLKKLEAESSEIIRNLKLEKEKEVQSIISQFEDSKKRETNVQSLMDQKTREVDVLEDENQKLKRIVTNMDKVIQEDKKKIEELNQKIRGLETEKEEVYDHTQGVISKLKNEMLVNEEETEKAFEMMKQLLNESKNENNDLLTKLGEEEKTVNKIQRRYEDLEQENEELSNNIRSMRKRMKELVSTNEELEHRLQTIKRKRTHTEHQEEREFGNYRRRNARNNDHYDHQISDDESERFDNSGNQRNSSHQRFSSSSKRRERSQKEENPIESGRKISYISNQIKMMRSQRERSSRTNFYQNTSNEDDLDDRDSFRSSRKSSNTAGNTSYGSSRNNDKTTSSKLSGRVLSFGGRQQERNENGRSQMSSSNYGYKDNRFTKNRNMQQQPRKQQENQREQPTEDQFRSRRRGGNFYGNRNTVNSSTSSNNNRRREDNVASLMNSGQKNGEFSSIDETMKYTENLQKRLTAIGLQKNVLDGEYQKITNSRRSVITLKRKREIERELQELKKERSSIQLELKKYLGNVY